MDLSTLILLCSIILAGTNTKTRGLNFRSRSEYRFAKKWTPSDSSDEHALYENDSSSEEVRTRGCKQSDCDSKKWFYDTKSSLNTTAIKFPSESVVKPNNQNGAKEEKGDIGVLEHEQPVQNTRDLSLSLSNSGNAEGKIAVNPSNSDAEARFIGYSIYPTMPTNTTGSTSIFTANYPTITLAQLARQLFFPNWLWTRFSATRKTGTGEVTLTTTKGTVAPTIKPTVASITYDNNLTRFLRLFTFVRFQNTPCASSNGQNGTCYTSNECNTLGGTGTTTCANGFGVCCVFEVRCGGTTNRNGSYFVSTGIVFSANQIRTCGIQIIKASAAVTQIRLDFRTFSLRQPIAGSCENDRFVVSGQNTNNIIPILCGSNTGSHIYVETSDTANAIQLSVLTTGDGNRSWNIQITQYTADNRNAAPSHCLQYYTGVMGTIRSFNYADTSPQYLNNLNYAICIRREAGFCSITYSNQSPGGTYQPFQIVNANADGVLIIPSGQAGLGVRNCPYDYILINGIRLCGERLNDGTTSALIVNDAPITDTSNGPFTVMVRTNEIDVGGGFNIYYRQNPCLSAPG